MNALLICPGRRPAVELLAESEPLAVAPLLGKSLVEYWIEHLAALGVRKVLISASDRASQVAARVGDGARWGLAIAVADDGCELSREQASERHPNDSPTRVVVLMDRLPGQPGISLFDSYASWFAGLEAWIPRAQALDRIGQCEVLPGVWLGMRARVGPGAVLLAPSWIGDYVSVGAGATVGPGAILEDGVIVAPGAHVAQSVIGPATQVGARVRISCSIARGSTLTNWTTNSCLRVADAFWLNSLSGSRRPAHPGPAAGPVKFTGDGCLLSVTELGELSGANSSRFRKAVWEAFSPELTVIEIDLSQTCILDSSGLAALCGLHRRARARGISLRLVNPAPAVRQLLELTQLHQFFGIDQAEPPRPGPTPAGQPRFHPAPVLVLAY